MVLQYTKTPFTTEANVQCQEHVENGLDLICNFFFSVQLSVTTESASCEVM